MSRVCLLVDHPLRDLDGLLLVAAHLAEEGSEVFLVPMYQKHEVWLLRPDLVVVNYLRHAHGAFLQTCLAAGIQIAVLDTEGGVRDFAGFSASVEPYLQGVSLYCVWGRMQFDELTGVSGRFGVRLEETGTPRYDFAAEPWLQALEAVDVGPGPMALVNTNFPLINPRFQDSEREIQELVKVGWREETARARAVQTERVCEEVVATTKTLAERRPAVTVVVRPHPFEGARMYERRFDGVPNIQVRQEGTVFEWLKRCSVLVHNNCSTAIEAAMMGREPVMIDWLDAPLVHQASTAVVSHRAKSLDEFRDLISQALAGRLAPSDRIRSARRDIIDRFFHAADGRAAARVSAAILEATRPRAAALSRFAYMRMVVGAPAGLSGRVRRGALMAGGNRLYRAGQSVARRSRMGAAKALAPDHAASLLRRLAAIRPVWRDMSLRAVERQDYFVSGWAAGESLRVAGA